MFYGIECISIVQFIFIFRQRKLDDINSQFYSMLVIKTVLYVYFQIA